MAVTLPEEDYQQEKERIAGLSLAYEGGDESIKGQVNTVLQDTSHFSGECYIAVYNESMNSYEYALAYDQLNQIIYVYGEDFNPDKIPTNLDFQAQAYQKVISIRTANDDNRGYSIYSFWDARYRFYETWTP